jgi:integrase
MPATARRPAGARTWYLFYKKGRTTRRSKLGTWPALELAKARKLARRERVRIETEGADPAHERHETRDVFTVADLAKLFIEQHAKAHKRTWKDDGWRLDRYILPAWKSRPVVEITRGDVHTLLDKIAVDKPIQANRVQALVSKLWNFAIDRGHAEVNPAHRMAKPSPERARATVLDDKALRALWSALDQVPGDASDAVRLRLLTGQRGGEVHSMAWADIDLAAAAWTIPATKAKNKRAHRVPLALPVVRVLEARKPTEATGAVFPGLYHQRKDLRALGGIHGDAYRWHDLRRTVASRLAALGYGEDLIGRLLNHAKRGVTATVYNQYAYDAEKRQALEHWARALESIVTGESPASKALRHRPRRRS